MHFIDFILHLIENAIILSHQNDSKTSLIPKYSETQNITKNILEIKYF